MTSRQTRERHWLKRGGMVELKYTEYLGIETLRSDLGPPLYGTGRQDMTIAIY